jgi:hypothetical protein
VPDTLQFVPIFLLLMSNMKSLIYYIVVIAALAFSVPARAIGLGLNMRDTAASGPMDPKALFSTPIEFMVQRLIGTDLTLDTALAEDRLFNYRLNIECATAVADAVPTLNAYYRVNRFTWANTFGFALLRSNAIRIWAGPQISLCYEFKSTDKSVSDAMLFNRLGPVIGININTSNDVTVSLETGFRTGFGVDLASSRHGVAWSNRIEPIMGIRLMCRSGNGGASALLGF